MSEADLWGQDIALDNDGQAKVAANGCLILTEEVETGLQDVFLRLFTRLGTLFYDADFGSLISDWFLEESTSQSRAALLGEITMRIEADPCVEPLSVSCRLLSYDANGVVIQAFWRFIDEDQPMNLVLRLDKQVGSLVVEDVNGAPQGIRFGGEEDGPFQKH